MDLYEKRSVIFMTIALKSFNIKKDHPVMEETSSYICTYMCTHIYTHICIHACILCTHICTYAYVYGMIYACVYVNVLMLINKEGYRV